ncbi:heavy-metal-associated domain-containing protein [Arthrobacter sp. SA17]
MCGLESHSHHHQAHGDHQHEHGDHHHEHADHHNADAGQTYNLEGLDCGHCVETVEKAVAAVPGVESATVDLVPDGVSRLTVSGTADKSELSDAVTAAGYSFNGYQQPLPLRVSRGYGGPNGWNCRPQS